MQIENMVKLRAAVGNRGEWLWAQKLEGNLARIDNVPFLTKDYSYKDVVSYDPETKNIEAVVEEFGGVVITYEYPVPSEAEALATYQKIVKLLRELSCATEGMYPGQAVVWIPPSISIAQAAEVIESNGGKLLDREEAETKLDAWAKRTGCMKCGTKPQGPSLQ